MTSQEQNALVFQAEDGRYVGAEVSKELPGYSGNGYVVGLKNDGDFVVRFRAILERGTVRDIFENPISSASKR